MLIYLGRESIPTFLTHQWPEWKEYSDSVLAASQALSINGIRLFEQQKKTAGLALPNLYQCVQLGRDFTQTNNERREQRLVCRCSCERRLPDVHKLPRLRHLSGNQVSQSAAAGIPCYHFGDINPKGLAIAERLTKSVKQRVSMFIPSFWHEYVGELYTGTIVWNSWEFSHDVSKIVRILAKEGKWLEQERIMLYGRLAAEVNNTICDILTSL